MTDQTAVADRLPRAFQVRSIRKQGQVRTTVDRVGIRGVAAVPVTFRIAMTSAAQVGWSLA